MAYSYEEQDGSPCAPYMQVTIGNPDSTKRRITCRGLLDTGADFTCIPAHLLRTIKVKATGRAAMFEGFAGSTSLTPYVVSFLLDGTLLENIEVWSWDGDFTLIGRDVLNQFCIEFDGLEELFSINHVDSGKNTD